MSRLSYPHNGNPYSWKDGLILKQDPCIWSLHQHCHNRNLYIEIITRHYIISIPRHTQEDDICDAIEMCDYSLHGCDEAGNRHNFISHRHGERKTELCPRVWWYYGDVCKHGTTVQGQAGWRGIDLHIQIYVNELSLWINNTSVIDVIIDQCNVLLPKCQTVTYTTDDLLLNGL